MSKTMGAIHPGAHGINFFCGLTRIYPQRGGAALKDKMSNGE